MRCTLAFLALVSSVGACAKQADSVAEPAYAAPGMSLEEYERMLTQNEVALRQQGVRVPPSGTKIARADERRANDGTRAVDEADLDDAASGEDASPVAGGVTSSQAEAPEAEPTEPAQPAPFPATEEASDAEYAPKSGGRLKRSNRQEEGEREQASDRCEMICDLAAATCDLEAKICSLASEHPRDARYQNACERAGRDCAIAQEACLACAE